MASHRILLVAAVIAGTVIGTAHGAAPTFPGAVPSRFFKSQLDQVEDLSGSFACHSTCLLPALVGPRARSPWSANPRHARAHGVRLYGTVRCSVWAHTHSTTNHRSTSSLREKALAHPCWTPLVWAVRRAIVRQPARAREWHPRLGERQLQRHLPGRWVDLHDHMQRRLQQSRWCKQEAQVHIWKFDVGQVRRECVRVHQRCRGPQRSLQPA